MMTQRLKLWIATLLFSTGLVCSLPLHRIEKRSAATYLGDLTAGASGILNADGKLTSASKYHTCVDKAFTIW